MKTVNSLSGGKTSSYMAVHHRADHNVFALVRTSDKKCEFPDKKVGQIVSDKIGCEFIGTLEDDQIIYTMLDLEQFIGSKIDWVTGETFDHVVLHEGKWLPNKLHRYCTTNMKLKPIFEWWYKNFDEPVYMAIGFRANEQRRAKKMIERCNDDGLLEYKATVEQHVDGRYKGKNKWQNFAWQSPIFPLISEVVYRDQIVEYWRDKPVRFAYMNNCVGCFHRNPLLLRKMFEKYPQKMDWFAKQEGRKDGKGTWRSDVSYYDIKNRKLQIELFDDDFNEFCDSGHCGI